MFRAGARELVTNKKYRPRIKLFTRLLILVGLLWLNSFPYMSRDVFTSENALSGRNMETQFGSDATTFSVYKRI